MRTIIRNNYDPKNGDYHETIVIDDERNKKYVFDCDGVFTDFTNPRVVSARGDSEDFAASQKWVTEIDDKVDGLAEDLGDEIQARTDADDAIWAEIEEIEMSSDVVDIVGTYAELQQYDTSHLKDNDIIKVLSDETHQNETAYYRFSTSTSAFSYVGSEGPYYTESEVDALLDDKQDTLIAGSNIQIAADGKTISATDTTYTHFTGATASTDGVQGLVPGPLAGDEDKVLKGDGTWGDAGADIVTFYANSFVGNNVTLYKDELFTAPATYAEVSTALENNTVRLVDTENSDVVAYVLDYWDKVDQGIQELLVKENFLNGNNSILLTTPSQQVVPSGNAVYSGSVLANYTLPTASSTVKGGLKVGSNLSINNEILLAKAMVGATASTAGDAGYVTAPAAGDQDKFLKGDGTWATVQGGGGGETLFYAAIDQNTFTPVFTTIYKDSSLQTAATAAEVLAAAKDGLVYIAYDMMPPMPFGTLAVYCQVEAYTEADPAATGSPYSITVVIHDYGTDTISSLASNPSSTTWVVGSIQYQQKLTAGTGITIDANNVISAPGASTNNINSTDWNALWQ